MNYTCVNLMRTDFIHPLKLILTPAVVIPNITHEREVSREKLFCQQMHQMAAVSGPLSSYHLKQAHMFCTTSLEMHVPIHLVVCVVSLRSCPGRACLWAECDVIGGFTVLIFDTFHTNTTQSFKSSHLYLYSTLYNRAEVMFLPSSLLWLSVSSWRSLPFLDFFFLAGSIKSSSSCVSDGSDSIFSSFWKYIIYLVHDDAWQWLLMGEQQCWTEQTRKCNDNLMWRLRYQFIFWKETKATER